MICKLATMMMHGDRPIHTSASFQFISMPIHALDQPLPPPGNCLHNTSSPISQHQTHPHFTLYQPYTNGDIFDPIYRLCTSQHPKLTIPSKLTPSMLTFLPTNPTIPANIPTLPQKAFKLISVSAKTINAERTTRRRALSYVCIYITRQNVHKTSSPK